MKTKKQFRIHKQDKKVLIDFIDYARLKKPENVNLEIDARFMAQRLQINPDQSNIRIANKFASLIERGKIIGKIYA